MNSSASYQQVNKPCHRWQATVCSLIVSTQLAKVNNTQRLPVCYWESAPASQTSSDGVCMQRSQWAYNKETDRVSCFGLTRKMFLGWRIVPLTIWTRQSRNVRHGYHPGGYMEMLQMLTFSVTPSLVSWFSSWFKDTFMHLRHRETWWHHYSVVCVLVCVCGCNVGLPRVSVLTLWLRSLSTLVT